MNAPIKSITAIVTAYALVTGLTVEAVRAGFVAAGAKDLRLVSNAAGAMSLLMTQVHDQVDPEVNKALQEDTLMKIMMGDYGPAVDLSELADEIEHQANLDTILGIKKEQPQDRAELMLQDEEDAIKVGDTVVLKNNEYFGAEFAKGKTGKVTAIIPEQGAYDVEVALDVPPADDFNASYPFSRDELEVVSVDPVKGPEQVGTGFTGCGPSRKPAPAEVAQVNKELLSA